MGAVTVRTVEGRDRRAFCRLLDEFRPRIAGLRSPLTYRAVFSDAFVSPHILIVVATDGGKLVGFSLTAIDWNRYQRRFALQHPLLATLSGLKKVLDGVRVALRPLASGRTDAVGAGIEADGMNDRSWRDSSPDIAKVIYTGVTRAARHHGVAYAMARYRTELLRELGVRRVDSIVAPNNAAAIHLNEKLGYRAERRGAVLLMSTELIPETRA
jgi:ribosomal protein S18 acetylase RimI-like enzyme